MVKIGTIMSVNADSPEKAVENIKTQLIENSQIKPCDPVEFIVIEEGNPD